MVAAAFQLTWAFAACFVQDVQPVDSLPGASGRGGVLPVDLTALSVSFWIRFPSRTDQRIVYQELDDIVVAEYDAETLCEKFVVLGPD